MRQDYPELRRQGAELLAIIPERAERVAAYFTANDLPFPGIPDPDNRLGQVYRQENWLVRLRGHLPALFVVDLSGVVRHADYGTRPEDVASTPEVLAVLQQLQDASEGRSLPHADLSMLVAGTSALMDGRLELAQFYQRELQQAGMGNREWLRALLARTRAELLADRVLFAFLQGASAQSRAEIQQWVAESLEEMQRSSVTRDELLLIAQALEAKDAYTAGHGARVGTFARQIGFRLELPGADLDELELAGILHDIGKISTPLSILHKPGRLSPEEWAVMQQHPVVSAQLVADVPSLQHLVPPLRHHHEAWDGSGYPDRLAGDAIPLAARILAVADSYDAMTSDRPYRTGMPVEKARQILAAGSGKQWDPAVVDAMLAD